MTGEQLDYAWENIRNKKSPSDRSFCQKTKDKIFSAIPLLLPDIPVTQSRRPAVFS